MKINADGFFGKVRHENWFLKVVCRFDSFNQFEGE